jgi:hypothetical protein
MELETVNVLRTDYSEITDALEMKQFVLNRVNAGKASALYAIPNITAAVYNAGIFAADAIQAAIDFYVLFPTKGNAGTIKDKVALAIKWLDSLVAVVVPIANDPANCATREAAATNISIIGFAPEKLFFSSKGTPPTMVFTATYVGDGIVEIDIIMPPDFNPTTITIVAVAIPPVTNPATPPPIVSLENGQVLITAKVFVASFTKTITGKGKSLKLLKMNTCTNWNIYMYCQHGNTQISLLSAPVPVSLLTPPTD